MTLKYFTFFTTVILLGGCASTQESFSAPDGTKYEKVKCSQSSIECLQKASKSCSGGPYKVISSESHAGGLVADIFPGPVTWYSMTFVCGTSDGKMPNFPFTGATYTPPTQVNVHHTGSIYHY